MADDDVSQKQPRLILIGIPYCSIDDNGSHLLNLLTIVAMKLYCTVADEELAKLEQLVGPIRKLCAEIENPDEILSLAKGHVVAVLVVGDTLQATTHVDLQLQAVNTELTVRLFMEFQSPT